MFDGFVTNNIDLAENTRLVENDYWNLEATFGKSTISEELSNCAIDIAG